MVSRSTSKWMGAAGSTSVTANLRSSYEIKLTSSRAECRVLAENY